MPQLRALLGAILLCAPTVFACGSDGGQTDGTTSLSSGTSNTTSSGPQGGGGAGAMGGGGPQGGGGATTGAGAGGSAGGNGGAGGFVEPPPGRVRVVAANLTSGNNQSYDLQHGVRILQGLAPDVVVLQEFNYNSNSSSQIATLVGLICGGDECDYHRGPSAEIPNGIISRLPILASGSWTDPEVQNRRFEWARINVAGDRDLWAISVHLLSTSASKRASEATSLMSFINATIPANDYVVLGGDFNTNSRGEDAVNILGSGFDMGGPYPVDQQGNDNTNAPRSSPYDWVVADGDLSVEEIPVEIGANVFNAGAVIDTRVYSPLGDLAPATANDSAASGMQHMAVVKDFYIDGRRR